MLLEGLVLGTFTTLGFALLYGKLPPWLKTFMINHPVTTEIVLSVGFYALMGMTLTAHFAVAAMVLEVQALLHIARHPEKFLFLQAAKEKAKAAFRGLTDKIDQVNEDYKRQHLIVDAEVVVSK